MQIRPTQTVRDEVGYSNAVRNLLWGRLRGMEVWWGKAHFLHGRLRKVLDVAGFLKTRYGAEHRRWTRPVRE